eukprot:105557-Alexandrium_andersonii.AAC.1
MRRPRAGRRVPDLPRTGPRRWLDAPARVDTPSTLDTWQGTGPWDGLLRAAPAAEAASAAPTGRGWVSGRACRTPQRRPR